jgi:hypothetical protein
MDGSQQFVLESERACDAQKSPFARLPDWKYRLHDLNRSSFNLALLKYFDFDGFLITGQHSGTHWIKWMLSHAIAHHYGVPGPRYVNNASSNEIVGHPKHSRIYKQLPRIASTHSIAPYPLAWAWARRLRRPPPYAVIVRDVRDVLISNYEKWRDVYNVPFSTYVKGDPGGHKYVCDVWWYLRFANRWGAVAQKFPAETLVLHYEDFVRAPAASLARLARHFGLRLTAADIAAGVAVGSKDVMLRHQDPGVSERPVRADGSGKHRFPAPIQPFWTGFWRGTSGMILATAIYAAAFRAQLIAKTPSARPPAPPPPRPMSRPIPGRRR